MSQLIFTTHLKERLRDRHMSGAQVESTFFSPDKRYGGRQSGTTTFEKRFGKQRVTLIAKQNERREWIAVSAWVDPPNSGTRDAKKRELWKKYQRAGFWGKWWITFRRVLGI